MYVQKSFISNTMFANNTPGVVAQLGELSSLSHTFAREKGYYSNKDTAPNLLVTTFTSNDGTVKITVPNIIAQQTLEIAAFIYNQTLGGITDITATVLLENLLTTFTGKASDFECGNMVSDGTHTLPEYVSWKCLTDSAHGDNIIKVWFVDASFQQQYEEYEIYVIPPFTTLNNFFLPGSDVEVLMGALTSAGTMDRIQAAKQGYPETIVRTQTYNYIDPLNSNHIVPADWSVLIYGPAGDNIDSIKDALMAFILANSTHDRPSWVNIFPDIFKRTEFILLPLMDQFSIPNLVMTTGIYSPQVKLSTSVAKMKQYATQYPDPHISSYLTMMGHPYRSVAILSIGSPDNREAKYELMDIFPDLIAVTSTSPDFNRMSQTTQDWASMLAEMLQVAESVEEFTSVPPGMQKVHRDGILYLTKSFQNISYLVVAKSNMSEG